MMKMISLKGESSKSPGLVKISPCASKPNSMVANSKDAVHASLIARNHTWLVRWNFDTRTLEI